MTQPPVPTALDEMNERLSAWNERLPVDLRPALERHTSNLVALAQSLEAAGRSPEVIRDCLRDLLASYEADLLRALSSGRLA